MSNIKTTFWFTELKLLDCFIDVLLREDEYCIQISQTNGKIFKREFIKYEN